MKKTRQEVFSLETSRYSSIPASEFIGWLADHWAKVPEEFRDNAVVVIEIDYEDYDGELTLSYSRPETDAEELERETAEKLRAAEVMQARERQEREVYAALKRKYG